MQLNQEVNRATLILDNKEPARQEENTNRKYIRRIIINGLLSLILIFVIIYTLPMTVLSFKALLEYATIVALVIFLFVLLFRYFAILSLAYLYINEYTYNPAESGYFPFVSILVPVYNEEKVITDSITSLLQLDYPNYEIIIINDGSIDGTKNVAEALVGYQRGKYNDIKPRHKNCNSERGL